MFPFSVFRRWCSPAREKTGRRFSHSCRLSGLEEGPPCWVACGSPKASCGVQTGQPRASQGTTLRQHLFQVASGAIVSFPEAWRYAKVIKRSQLGQGLTQMGFSFEPKASARVSGCFIRIWVFHFSYSLPHTLVAKLQVLI